MNVRQDHGIDLYVTPGSPPCRLVLLVAAALNLELNIKLVNLEAGEQFKDDFLKAAGGNLTTGEDFKADIMELNPQHTVPTIVDEGFALWESRAISRYLINKYGNDSTLYPTHLETRAWIDQRLDFDIGTLYPRFGRYFYPQLFGGKAEVEHLKNLQDSLNLLEVFLVGHTYAVGGKLTLADLSLVATVSTIEAAGIDIKSYKKIQKWYTLVKNTAPSYEDINEEGIKQFKEFISKLKASHSEL